MEEFFYGTYNLINFVINKYQHSLPKFNLHHSLSLLRLHAGRMKYQDQNLL